jgi:hypothetical protein
MTTTATPAYPDGAAPWAALSVLSAEPAPSSWDGYGSYPATAETDANHVLSEWHNYAALSGLCGPSAAAAETGADAYTQGVRLAAALAALLAECAALRVLAAPAEVPR